MNKTSFRCIEEVGIEVSNLRYVNSSSLVTDSGIHVVDIVFYCDHTSGEAFAKSPDEVDEVIWMNTQQILVILIYQYI